MGPFKEALDKAEREQDLGGGLFASFDGYRVTLRKASRWRTHTIQFTPGTLLAFERYINQLQQIYRNARQAKEMLTKIEEAIRKGSKP